eukprot:12110418-Alexandrium_andersonii.AAC.1
MVQARTWPFRHIVDEHANSLHAFRMSPARPTKQLKAGIRSSGGVFRPIPNLPAKGVGERANGASLGGS